jgi:hypothetical protein
MGTTAQLLVNSDCGPGLAEEVAMPYLTNVARDRQRVWAFDRISAELFARQDQSHRAIAKHLRLPRKMVNEMCERIVYYSRCPCPHPPK